MMIKPTVTSRRNVKHRWAPGDARKRRAQVTVSVRKAKKEENVAKRRNLGDTSGLQTGADGNAHQHGDGIAMVSQEDFARVVEGVKGCDAETALSCTRFLRHLLTTPRAAPVDAIIQAGLVPYLVSFLLRRDLQELQFEAVWALTNVASTHATPAVVEAGAVPALVQQVLMSDLPRLREQGTWCLGNIAGHSTQFRDIVLQSGALKLVMASVLEPGGEIAMIRTATWCVSNMCRGRPAAPLAVIGEALALMGRVVQSTDDPGLLRDALWALAYIVDQPEGNEAVQGVLNTGAVPALVNLLRHPDQTVALPAVRLLGQIATGTTEQTQALLDAGVLRPLTELLEGCNNLIKKDVAWLLSNVAAGTLEQAHALCMHPKLLRNAVDAMAEEEPMIQYELGHLCQHITQLGDWKLVGEVVEHGAMAPLCDMLDSPDPGLIMLSLRVLEGFLETDRDDGDWGRWLESENGFDIIEGLTNHPNEDIADKAVSFLECWSPYSDYGSDGEAPDEDSGEFEGGDEVGAPAGAVSAGALNGPVLQHSHGHATETFQFGAALPPPPGGFNFLAAMAGSGNQAT